MQIDLDNGQHYTLREANQHDQGSILSLVSQVLKEYGLSIDDCGETDADLKDLKRHYKGGTFQVLEVGGRIVGTLGLYQIDERSVELRKMYLLPETRGKGLGKRLLNWAVDWAREQGFERMELETAGVLEEAIGLYESFGFEKFEHPGLAKRCDQGYEKIIC